MYRGEDWDSIRESCYKRDGYKCRGCGSTDKIDAHHIIPYRLTKDNNLSNLITYCPRCHKHNENKFNQFGFTRYVKDLIELNKSMEQ